MNPARRIHNRGPDPKRNGASRALLLALAVACTTGPACWAAPDDSTVRPEYGIKAAYIYKFLTFFTVADRESDASSKPVYRIAILGNSPFGNAFDAIDGTRIGTSEQRVRVDATTFGIDGSHLARYDIVFICRSEKNRLDQILAVTSGHPILTVADMDGFLRRGGMINLVVVQNRVRWEINQQAAEREGIHLSSQLMRNATRVIPRDRP